MNDYNKLKLRAMSVFVSEGTEWISASEAAERLGFSPRRSTWTYLKRLWKFGLLERRSLGGGNLEYRISNGGIARLRWLRSQRG